MSARPGRPTRHVPGLIGADGDAAAHRPHHPVVASLVRRATARDLCTLEEFALVTGFLGTLHLVEGVGLWLSRTRAEHLWVASTSALLPLEIHEIVAEFHLVKVLTPVVNVAAVVYLTRRVRQRKRH